jgi:hypothetical protein
MKQQTVYAKAKSALLLTVALVTFSVASSFAQGRFSAGAELALPSGDFGDAVGTGFGVSVRYEAPINDNLSWMATAGFLTFGKKEVAGIDYSASLIPINAGLKYYFTESFNGFYGGVELGLNIAKAKAKGEIAGFEVDESESSTEFGFAPQVGYHLANFDFAVRYAIVSDFDYIGIRAAYVFGGE